jgi:hypothetical protein
VKGRGNGPKANQVVSGSLQLQIRSTRISSVPASNYLDLSYTSSDFLEVHKKTCNPADSLTGVLDYAVQMDAITTITKDPTVRNEEVEACVSKEG